MSGLVTRPAKNSAAYALRMLAKDQAWKSWPVLQVLTHSVHTWLWCKVCWGSNIYPLSKEPSYEEPCWATKLLKLKSLPLRMFLPVSHKCWFQWEGGLGVEQIGLWEGWNTGKRNLKWKSGQEALLLSAYQGVSVLSGCSFYSDDLWPRLDNGICSTISYDRMPYPRGRTAVCQELWNTGWESRTLKRRG